MVRLSTNLRSRAAGTGFRRSMHRTFRSAWCVALYGCCAAAASVAQLRADETTDAATDALADSVATDSAAAAEEATAAAAATAAADDHAATSDASAVKDESRFVRARFSDGTILIGELLLDDLEVETDFGTLTVPREQLLGLSPGLDSRSDFDERLDNLIADLTSADRAVAAAADRALTQLGPAISGELARRADELEGEQAKRVEVLLHRIEEAASDLESVDGRATRPLLRKDRIRTTKFTIVGRIVPQNLRFKSRYGEVDVDIADVVAVERQIDDEREDVAKTFSVTGQNLAATKMKTTGISVRRGDRIVVRASGMIRRTPGTSSYVSSPDGSTRFGTHSTDPQILGGTLIARIGTRGKDIKVGSNASFVAKQSGKLTFGVGMRPDYVGRYPFPGEYKVQLRVQRGE